jgi:NADH:ubiquinone oxidoreductase subunit K
MIPLAHILVLSGLLFLVGLAIVITRKNYILMLMGIELMLNAANINLVAFSKTSAGAMQGQFFALFVMVVAVAEVAVALAILLKVYQYYQSVNTHDTTQLKG